MNRFMKGITMMSMMYAAAGLTDEHYRERPEPKTIEEQIAERREKGIKSNYTPKPVKPYQGKKKLSKKERKAKNQGK